MQLFVCICYIQCRRRRRRRMKTEIDSIEKFHTTHFPTRSIAYLEYIYLFSFIFFLSVSMFYFLYHVVLSICAIGYIQFSMVAEEKKNEWQIL